MPVYHVDAFDVSAIQIDLSANFFTADSANLSAEYWVKKVVDFNSGGAIKDDTALNTQFKGIFTTSSTDYVGTTAVFRNSGGTRTSDYSTATTAVTGVQFKDLGVIKADHTLYTNTLYSNVDALTTSDNNTTSFNGKARAVLIAKSSVTGLRERMRASINVGSNPDVDLAITSPVPAGSQFGFLVVRNLNLAGTSQDRTIHIGIVLEQS